ncbi:polysaccharide biosynthesis tyrosine autokinase [Desulfopila sp. IMCC35006]|uniref:polysaccharide biosynthesis tyrosine autokinase n=1 Tax=Desulfopila sp. IMCC35006 TaxID=2569542 RepID=UPI0010AB934C|nr:polysaccharide biosynthesis tyrosine autokinase [Desulfopila sp. IMCC35006]TKB24926.1 polysaccharide biosynthesis tyrosine autokinase [Desulfopila sp. IMCC35006]
MGKTSKALKKSGYSLEVPLQSTTDTQTERLVRSADNAATGGNEEKPFLVREPQRTEIYSPQWDERLTKVASFSSKIAESFRVLRSKILIPQDGRPAPKTIMVTSALPREGKSFVSANLAIALAQGVDQHALLVDCDLRAPSLAQLFGLPSDRGLADYLLDKDDISSVIRNTSMEKLTILPSGLPPVNPAELLGSERMHKLIAELAGRYPDRYVIFDTPPLEVASESQVLSQVVDGVVLVVRQGFSSRNLIEKFISEIGKNKIIGVIFNGHKSNFISTRLVDKSHYYYGNYYNNTGQKSGMSS